MKMFTNNEQTAKLIELGFEKPKSSVECDLPKGDWRIGQAGIRKAYSIGELIEMLPISFENDNDDTSWLEIEAGAVWSISYSSFGFIDYDCERKELIDALFDMIVKLKEEEII
jgi:hypothetical protein